MKKFLQIYGCGLVLLCPVLIAVGLTDPSADPHRHSMATVVGLNSLVIGGFMILAAQRRK